MALSAKLELQEIGAFQRKRLGNRRISTEAIKAQIRTQSGELFSEPMIKADIERLRGLGEFDDVRIQDDVSRIGGRILTFQVYEKLPSHQ